jgi:hypothetical protein
MLECGGREQKGGVQGVEGGAAEDKRRRGTHLFQLLRRERLIEALRHSPQQAFKALDIGLTARLPIQTRDDFVDLPLDHAQRIGAGASGDGLFHPARELTDERIELRQLSRRELRPQQRSEGSWRYSQSVTG